MPEPYHLPQKTADAIARARRIVAIGTTVTRALEHARRGGGVCAGTGLADQRIGPETELGIVDAILTGTHEKGSSHHQLLRAFATDRVLAHAAEVLAAEGFRTHEFGDSMLVERRASAAAAGARHDPIKSDRSGCSRRRNRRHAPW
ncbi:MAG TPA: S-adenosylmethionine:tRNA ribosyltransferase-isomerase [Stellaceae bacterium]|nr:S-adenosylmethionine:tRNA ribosyltransferase-isomerase [Stellaceae bacterium]